MKLWTEMENYFLTVIASNGIRTHDFNLFQSRPDSRVETQLVIMYNEYLQSSLGGF